MRTKMKSLFPFLDEKRDILGHFGKPSIDSSSKDSVTLLKGGNETIFVNNISDFESQSLNPKKSRYVLAKISHSSHSIDIDL